MTKFSRKLYNFRTHFTHRILHLPVKLKVNSDNRLKNPALTVIFLHGISATSRTWQATVRELSKDPRFHKVRIITLDLLGFGKSLQADWLDYDYDDYNKALNSAIKRLKISSPLVLVGHSMGALIAANYSVNYHYDCDLVSLILVSPPVLMADELAHLPDKVYTKSYSALSHLAEQEPAVSVIANFIQRFTSFRSQYLKTPAFAKAMENVVLNHSNYRTFTKIKLPTLIIHGHFDPLVMRSNLKRVAAVNSSHLRYVSVMGHHDISSNKRAKIYAELNRILKEECQNA